MNQYSLLNWMLLSTVLLGLWWLGYHLALRHERGFAYNRAYLVLGPLLAAGLPLLPLAWPAGWGGGPASLPGVAAVLLPAVRAMAPGALAETAGADGAWWLLAGHLGGATLRLLRLAAGLGRLWWATRGLPREARAGYTLVRTHGRLPTSSFGRVVFWDDTQPLSAAEARQVLAHELAHVRQRHTHDRVAVELLRAVLWFNPFVHLCGRALALTHEFQADEAALRGAAAPSASLSAAYARLLARQVAGRLGFAVPLAHTFSHSQTLTRIAMMQKTTPVRRWKQWLAVPLLGGLLLAVAYEKAAAQTKQTNVQQAPPPPVPVPSRTEPAQEVKLYTYVEQMPTLASGGGNAAIVEAIQRNIVYPVGSSASGRVFVSFTVNPAGGVQDTKVVKGLTPDFDQAVVAAVEKLPQFNPGKQGGKPVSVSFTVPVTFAQKPARK